MNNSSHKSVKHIHSLYNNILRLLSHLCNLSWDLGLQGRMTSHTRWFPMSISYSAYLNKIQKAIGPLQLFLLNKSFTEHTLYAVYYGFKN